MDEEGGGAGSRVRFEVQSCRPVVQPALTPRRVVPAAGVEEPMCFNTIRQLASEGRYSKEAFLASDYEKRAHVEDQNVCRTVGAAVLGRGTKTDEDEYTANILAVDQTKGNVHVHFQGWRRKFDEWVPVKHVRTERRMEKADRAEQERLHEADVEELPSA